MTVCPSPLSRSLFGAKRTSLFAAQMCAFDPKRTLVRRGCRGIGRLSRVGIVCVRKKQLLAVDLVAGDGLLALRRPQRVDELLSEVFLHIRILVRVHQNDAVLIEQAFVALNHNFHPVSGNESMCPGRKLCSRCGRAPYRAWLPYLARQICTMRRLVPGC